MKGQVSIYVVRHAAAAERGDAYPDDSQRPLTADGASKFKTAARALAESGVEVDCILTSPFVRARQTADILAAALGGRPRIVETRALEPGAAFKDLLGTLHSHTDCGALAVVGHEPGIGEAAGRLAGAPRLEFKKGAICRIDFDAWPLKVPGTLAWFVTPKLVNAIAG